MISSVLIFGAPVMDPPGKALRTHSTGEAEGGSWPVTVETS